ncbi:hypothetical protein Tco_0577050 [Tanacetum coccineum]
MGLNISYQLSDELLKLSSGRAFCKQSMDVLGTAVCLGLHDMAMADCAVAIQRIKNPSALCNINLSFNGHKIMPSFSPSINGIDCMQQYADKDSNQHCNLVYILANNGSVNEFPGRCSLSKLMKFFPALLQSMRIRLICFEGSCVFWIELSVEEKDLVERRRETFCSSDAGSGLS